MKIFIIIISLYISVLIHELGHYLTSKFFKIPVTTFCIGNGPTLLTFNKFNTKFIFKPIPFTGYISNEPKDLDKISFIKEWIILLAGVTVNLIACVISLSIFYNKSFLTTFNLLITKILIPQFNNLLNISNHFGSNHAISSTFTETLNNFNQNEFFLVFAAFNLILFCFNLLPLPILDGGQLIMSIIRRWGNKSPKRAKVTEKISSIIYLFCWILLISPLFINEALKLATPIQIFLYTIMVVLNILLFRVIKETQLYKSIIKK